MEVKICNSRNAERVKSIMTGELETFNVDQLSPINRGFSFPDSTIDEYWDYLKYLIDTYNRINSDMIESLEKELASDECTIDDDPDAEIIKRILVDGEVRSQSGIFEALIELNVFVNKYVYCINTDTKLVITYTDTTIAEYAEVWSHASDYVYETLIDDQLYDELTEEELSTDPYTSIDERCYIDKILSGTNLDDEVNRISKLTVSKFIDELRKSDCSACGSLFGDCLNELFDKVAKLNDTESKSATKSTESTKKSFSKSACDSCTDAECFMKSLSDNDKRKLTTADKHVFVIVKRI